MAAVSGDVFAAADGPKRRRRLRPLSTRAQERLDAMASILPMKGERITIRWPGGPHDFVMEFEIEDTHIAGPPGWYYLHGLVVSPANWHPRWWSPMVHLVDGKWTMLPKGGRLSDA